MKNIENIKGNKKRDNRGVTLVEIILVLGIMSLISLMSFPSIKSITRYRDKVDLNQLIKDITYAKNQAICEAKIYSISFHKKENYYVTRKYEKFPRVVKKNKIEGSLKIKATNFHCNQLWFNPTGAPRSGGTIYLKDGKEDNIELRILPATGKINVYINKEKQ